MATPAPERINWGKIVDLAVLFGGWTIGAVALARLSGGDDKLMGGILYLVTPVNALYLQIRLAPRLAALAQKGWREELAVTLLPARKYLLGRLKAPFWLAVAPVATLLPLAFTAFAVKQPDFFPWGPIIFLILFSVLSISVAGLADLFARLLRRGKDPGAALLLIPLCWSVAAVGLPLGGGIGVLFLWLSIHGIFGNDAWLAVYGLPLGLILNAAALVIAVRRWRTACRRYYQFDGD